MVTPTPWSPTSLPAEANRDGHGPCRGNRLRNPRRPCGKSRCADHRRLRCRRAGRHFGNAGGKGGRDRHPEALRHRYAQELRVVPPVSGRNRRPRRHAGFVHHPGRRGHDRPYPDRAAQEAEARGYGTLYLRPSRSIA